MRSKLIADVSDHPVARSGEEKTLRFFSPNWPRNLLIVVLFTEGWLIFLHLRLAVGATATDSVLGQAFDFTRESSLPTFVGCLIALAVAVSAFFIHLLKNRRQKTYSWLGVAALFALIAFDDAVGFHERIGAITSLKLLEEFGYPSYPWHITVAPFIGGGLLVVVCLIWRDIRSIPGLTSMLILSLVCYASAFGLDVIEGVEQMALMQGDVSEEGGPMLPFLMMTEEVLEMAATTFFLFVTYSYFLSLINQVKFGVSSELPIPAAALEIGMEQGKVESVS